MKNKKKKSNRQVVAKVRCPFCGEKDAHKNPLNGTFYCPDCPVISFFI